MDNKEKYLKWLEIAENDMDTADFMFKNGRYSYVTFMCEQAVEKLVKGIYVYIYDKEAPYTHNINSIIVKIDTIADNPTYKNYISFINQLFLYYTATRYDAYKEKISKDIDEKTSEEIINKTKEVFEWLKSQVIL